MKARAIPRWVSAPLLVVLLTQTGCYDWVAVKPADARDLPSLSVGADDAGRWGQLSSDDADLRVELNNGEVMNFRRPVRIDVDNEEGTLVFRGADSNGPTRVKRDQIVWLKASQYNPNKTTAAIVVGVLVSLALVVTTVLVDAATAAKPDPLQGAHFD